jgi:hypothetical protein
LSVLQTDERTQLQRERAEFEDTTQQYGLQIVELALELRTAKRVANEALEALHRELHRPTPLT